MSNKDTATIADSQAVNCAGEFVLAVGGSVLAPPCGTICMMCHWGLVQRLSSSDSVHFIPSPIVAALYCLFFAYVGSVGLSFLQFCNLNSFRTKFILGFSVFMGLSVPQYFNEYTAIKGYGPVHTSARWFNDMVNVPFSSEAFVAGILALYLDITLHRKDRAIRRDRGRHWWDRFRSFKTDTRSEEFYSLPFNLNKFFPSV
ncbi:nucleobase-ascorbate transporter 6-like [Macadamia integrifolia]|uniref:nucleobase-ascorbate transporter 6-like n=1 Tax=Macadamia integrifolia TaxID=60698 RepID=UPI001C4F947A|nr:nucleobase-ascorbate transporter 6-like [Macadamia integrifolia]